jgi:hypothetical protein
MLKTNLFRADPSCSGRVYMDRFDSLIEEAAALPRRYGYAPVTSRLYPTLDQRKVRSTLKPKYLLYVEIHSYKLFTLYASILMHCGYVLYIHDGFGINVQRHQKIILTLCVQFNSVFLPCFLCIFCKYWA